MSFWTGLTTIGTAGVTLVTTGTRVLVKTASVIETAVDAGQASADWVLVQANALLNAEVRTRAAEYGWACTTAQELEICKELLLAMGDERVAAAARVTQAQPLTPVVQLPPTAPAPNSWANGVPDHPPV